MDIVGTRWEGEKGVEDDRVLVRTEGTVEKTQVREGVAHMWTELI